MKQDWTTGIRPGGTLPLALHADFSACLLELGTLARHARTDMLVRDALLAWRRLVPFDAGWWGEVAADRPRNLLHGSIGLDAEFADEWNRLIAAQDTFAQGSMAQPGTVFRASGGYRGPPGAIADFIDRHRLHAIMAITVALPGSGLQFFIALYRHDPHDGFGDTEGALFAEFTRHLVQAWRHRLADLRMPGPLDAMALCDREGRLCYLGRRIAALFNKQLGERPRGPLRGPPGGRSHGPSDGHEGIWRGTTLPPALIAALHDAPRCIRFAGARLSLEPVGELVAVSLSVNALALTPRELSTALLFAQGLSYKEVARVLALSPATVRTYLKTAYARLEVTNKVALIGALNSATSINDDAGGA
ncbi:LuxR family transcriptional regulator [Massilia dura]|uniref:LuxR family transcriptional regulator n=1 Tax=Pseudoduganella dura TaxID=321982 RepID=A0A6I3XCQ2_9BURK|nr:helix-turn-helix transcriptional regulator [Pseudoduganella dura]MUI14177.1 LuxR family transcriptional regulator [Pseudoduganella dura]GGX76637.1 helix-turn-helix transcriptional regulator [Pseudoduganella dura]